MVIKNNLKPEVKLFQGLAVLLEACRFHTLDNLQGHQHETNIHDVFERLLVAGPERDLFVSDFLLFGEFW